jgi:hypothetical protein
MTLSSIHAIATQLIDFECHLAQLDCSSAPEEREIVQNLVADLRDELDTHLRHYERRRLRIKNERLIDHCYMLLDHGEAWLEDLAMSNTFFGNVKKLLAQHNAIASQTELALAFAEIIPSDCGAPRPAVFTQLPANAGRRAQ